MGYYTRNCSLIGTGNQPQPVGVHDTEFSFHNPYSPGPTDLASLFGVSPTASTTLEYQWDNNYTESHQNNNNQGYNYVGNQYNFVSGFGITTQDNLGRIQGYLHTTLSNLTACSSVTAYNVNGYTPSYATNFGVATNGCWFYYSDYNSNPVGYGLFTFNNGLGSALGVATQGYGSVTGAYHNCYVCSITCNNKTYYFTTKATYKNNPLVYSQGGGMVMYPTNLTSFPSFASTIGATTTAPSNIFLY